MKLLPSRIEKSPIANSSLEVRFISKIHSDAVFGVLFGALKHNYDQIIKLPILEIPDTLRNKDPNLKFQPYYQMNNSRYIIQIGPSVISIHPREYFGWTDYSFNIESLFKIVWSTDLIQTIERVGLRYINVFPNQNILNNIKLSINFIDYHHNSDSLYFRTILKNELFKTLIQITNDTTFTKNDTLSHGSIIDLDTTFQFNDLDILKLLSLINKAHQITKNNFFSILNDEFLKELKPIYE